MWLHESVMLNPTVKSFENIF